MVCSHRVVLRPIGGLLLLVGAGLAGSAAETDRIAMRFEVFNRAGFHVVTSRLEIEEGGDRYRIVSDLATRGVAGLLLDLADHSEVHGQLTADSARPDAFRSKIRRNSEDRRDWVDYHRDGSVDGSASPPPIVPIAGEQLRGTVDNLTAHFQIERRLARGDSCTLVIPIYEGRQRYDLRYTDGGEQTLSPAGGQRFSGATRVCHMKRAEIAGFPADPKESEGAREGTIWYARLTPGDLLVPVRMELETEVGLVTGYLAELHGRGVDLQLME